MKSMPYPASGATGRSAVANRVSSGAALLNETTEGTASDPLIGRRVRTRWPDDNNFYEAVITQYNPVEVCGAWSHINNKISHNVLAFFLCLHNFFDWLYILFIFFYQGRHALVYDIGTANETWEWVNLSEVNHVLSTWLGVLRDNYYVIVLLAMNYVYIQDKFIIVNI